MPTTNNFVDIWVWILFSFCAYSAPVCLYIHTQSVALGYILIGASPRLCSNVISQKYLWLRPVLARNICCTLSWTMFLLQLRPALACNICCTISWTMFLLRLAPSLLKCKLPNYLQLCPSLVHYRRCCTMPCRRYYLQSCSLRIS